MSKTSLASAFLTVFVLGCGGGDESVSDSAIVNDLTGRLVQENTQYYAFGCVDFEGSAFSGDYSPDAIARDVGIEHVADSWSAETSGVIVGGGGDQQYVVIHDPASDATDAQEFEEREIAFGDANLTYLVPK